MIGFETVLVSIQWSINPFGVLKKPNPAVNPEITLIQSWELSWQFEKYVCLIQEIEKSKIKVFLYNVHTFVNRCLVKDNN